MIALSIGVKKGISVGFVAASSRMVGFSFRFIDTPELFVLKKYSQEQI